MKKILTILICGLFIVSANAQEAAKQKIFTIRDYSGGIATKLDEQSTPNKYARTAENIRLGDNVRAITKRGQVYTFGTADTSEAITSLHRYYMKDLTKKLLTTHGDEIEVGNDTSGAFSNILTVSKPYYRWDWLTWHDLAIGGDGKNQPVKYDGTTATYLGAPAIAESTAGMLGGTYNYKVSCHATTYSMGFDVTSNDLTVSNKKINLTQIPIGPDTILGETTLGRNIYRSQHGATGTYKLLSNGKISDNTTTTLTDSDADASLGISYPAVTQTWTPPKGKLCLIHKNRLWIANNPDYPSRIWYSNDGSHDLFEMDVDYLDVRPNDGDEITVVDNLLGLLTIGKTNTFQKIFTDGDDPAADWSISDPFSNIGCDAMYSSANTPLGIIYLSKAKGGLYVFNGQSSVLKSEIATPVISDILSSNLGNVCGEYNNNIYYMAYASNTIGGSTNNRILIYDILTNSFTIDTLNINAFCSLNGGSDAGVLFAGASDSGKIYQFSTTAKQFIHNTWGDFTGTFAHARYIPASQGGESTNPVLEMSWDCTIDGWTAAILAIKPTFNSTINGINTVLTQAVIDRPTNTGTYVSQILSTTAASAYDKFYWNETLPTLTDATFAFRGGATHTDCTAASFSSEYTIPAGSDISGLTAYDFTQYRLSMSSTHTIYTPNITTEGGYTTKLTYSTIGSSVESSVPLNYKTGWLDFEIPAYQKTLRKIYVNHKGTLGTLTIKVTNEYGESDTFSIDLSTNPERYEEYFTRGGLVGKRFQIEITNADLNPLIIREISFISDVEPIY